VEEQIILNLDKWIMVVVVNVVVMEQVEIVVNPWIITRGDMVTMLIMVRTLKEEMDVVEVMVMAQDRVKDKEVVVVREEFNIKEEGVVKEKEVVK
jgi:hypothetical protein